MSATLQVGGRGEDGSGRRLRGRSSSPRATPSPTTAATSRRSRSTHRLEPQSQLTPITQLPGFLGQSQLEIKDRFEELEWLERKRILEGQQNADSKSRWAREEDFPSRSRNRYLNIFAWANHRIHLKVPPGRCDYINASPISLRDSSGKVETEYIATQGPKDGQFNHFWRMVWHETSEPAVIVMLTQVWEAGKDKCLQYFPKDLDEDALTYNDDDEFGDGFSATVKLIEVHEDDATKSTVRKLQLTVGEESKTVWHFLYSGWPDFSIPEGEDRECLLHLMRDSELKAGSRSASRIAHCSAGVGRTGTFIALDHLLQQMDLGVFDHTADSGDDAYDPIFDTVNLLREQRMAMVQSEAQMHFIYQLLRERFLSRHGLSVM